MAWLSKAAIRANRFFAQRENKAEFLRILKAQGFEEDEKNFDAIYEPILEYRIQVDASVHPGGMEMMIAEEKQAGAISPGFSAVDILRLDALRAAQRELGQY